MKKTYTKFSIIFMCLLTLSSAGSLLAKGGKKKNKSTSVNIKGKTLPGATVLAFGPDHVLFVGDSKAGVVHAIPTQATPVQDPIHINAPGIDRTIAEKLGVASSDLLINDMQVHPVSQEVYIALKKGHAPDAPALIAIVNPADPQDIRFLDIAQSGKSQVKIENVRTEDFDFYRDFPSAKLNITDIDYHEGHIYVAGLTNGEFASTLRKIKYPFDGAQSQVGSIEMYHAVHNQQETRAPIRTMAFETVNGESVLIGAYTCTPLVSIKTGEIREGNHIQAKTVAELGFGNTPIDLLIFDVQEMDGSFDRKLLLINKERSASLISLKDFEKADQGAGLNTFSLGPEGVAITPVPMAGVMQMSDQNPMMLAVLKRNIDSGEVDLYSKLKGAYFRLSDFQSEYEFPDYEYTETEPWKDFHNMIKPMEGYPELVKEK